jgi:hypothetical protein
MRVSLFLLCEMQILGAAAWLAMASKAARIGIWQAADLRTNEVLGQHT